MEHPGGDGVTGTCTLEMFKSYGTWRGTYCPVSLTKSMREFILQQGYQLDIANNYYVDNILNMLEIKTGTNWNPGTITDIDRIRCDGITEVSYEAAGERLFGGNSWWNIMLNVSNLNQHGGMLPNDQMSSSLSTNQADSLYK